LKTLFEYIPRIFVAFKKRDQRRLRKLNDYLLQDTALDCNKLNFEITILSYVLSKIVSKPRFLGHDFEPILRDIEFGLQELMRKIKGGNEEEVFKTLRRIESTIGRLDTQDPRFVVSLVTKGKLKMAATFYAQGMSLGIASEMTGMEKQEILDYAGQTMMFDRLKEEKTLRERMKIARQMISE
jgi:uncharacterized protein (DUF2164 family)